MVWTRSDTLGVARPKCAYCHGLGLKDGRLSETQPCPCVLRAIFRICFEKFVNVSRQEKRFSMVTLDSAGPGSRKVVWGRKDEEYLADFLSLARRTLSEDEHRIFRFHYLLGANWRICCQRLNMQKGDFFHQIYRIEEKVGRALRETTPYPLYPIDEYYNGMRVQHSAATAVPMEKREPVRAAIQRQPPKAA